MARRVFRAIHAQNLTHLFGKHRADELDEFIGDVPKMTILKLLAQNTNQIVTTSYEGLKNLPGMPDVESAVRADAMWPLTIYKNGPYAISRSFSLP